jgi:ubiquitin-protein ligase
MHDLASIRKEPMPYIKSTPDPNNLLTWYFMINGLDNCDYKDGQYIGKITYPSTYPYEAPRFMMLTPNGRFNTNINICMTNSSYHADQWSPLWTTRTILMGFLSIMMDNEEHGIGHIQSTSNDKQQCAKNSLGYNQQHCSNILKMFED